MLGFTVLALMAIGETAFCQDPEVDHDLLTYSMALSQDQQVKLRFPLDMRSGSMITGTVVEEKKDNTGIVSYTSSSLEGMVIEINGKQTNLGSHLISFLVPSGATALPFIIKNAKGELIQQGQLPVGIIADMEKLADLENPATFNGANFKPDAVCQPGQALTIAGKFDGNAATTHVIMGGQPAEVIAETENFTVVQVAPGIPAGVTTVDIAENNTRETHHVNVAILNLSAAKTTLKRGEKTPVTIIVSGVQMPASENEGNAPVCRVRITNLSPLVVRIKDLDGNSFSQTIPQGLSSDYKSTFKIVGVTKGSYTLSGTLYCVPNPQDKSENGPAYKEWQERYREALRKRLIEEGFTKDELTDILLDSVAGLAGPVAGIKGIIKNLWRLYKAYRAIKNARKDVGDPPDRSK